MIASLMMYARPELEQAHANYWALIRAELAKRGIDSPADLSNEAEEFSVWRSPDLVFSQTCGMPYRTMLHGEVTLIGTPDYGLEGCPPGHYRSAIVVHRDDLREDLAEFAQARLAYNATISQSGFAAIYNTAKPLGFWFANRCESGGHLNSARMVAERQAEIAALDAVTWRLIRRYEPFADKLRVLMWTTPTPGLPYIAAKGADQQATFAAVHTAIGALNAEDRAALGIQDLVSIPAQDYLAIPNPPETSS